MIREYLNNHWMYLVFFSLLFGFTGWFLWSYAIFQAYSTDFFGDWVIEISFNDFGEGPFEIVLFPLLTAFIGTTLYVFYKKMNA